jgi:hypothetical protein
MARPCAARSEPWQVGGLARRGAGKPALGPQNGDFRAFNQALSALLYRVCALALGLPEDWFDIRTDRHRNVIRAISYPGTTILYYTTTLLHYTTILHCYTTLLYYTTTILLYYLLHYYTSTAPYPSQDSTRPPRPADCARRPTQVSRHGMGRIYYTIILHYTTLLYDTTILHFIPIHYTTALYY